MKKRIELTSGRARGLLLLCAILLLIPYGFVWLVYSASGIIDFYGYSVFPVALLIVLAYTILLLCGKGCVWGGTLCHLALLILPLWAFFDWGRFSSFAADYTFWRHVVVKLPMSRPAFWMALLLPLISFSLLWRLRKKI